MKKIMISTLVASALAFSGGDIAPVEPVVSEPTETVNGWEYTGQIYLWGASIDGTSGKGSPISIDFSDLMDNLKMAGMGTLSATNDKWTLMADIIYMNVDKSGLNTSPGPGPITLHSFGLKALIVQPIASYAVHVTDTYRFEILAGARYISVETPLGFSVPDQKITPSDDAWNAIIGIRGTHDFSDKWFGNYHFDVGTGDSDSTWQGLVGIGYKFEKYSLLAGYRYLTWDHGGDAIDDLTMDGVYAGVRFKF